MKTKRWLWGVFAICACSALAQARDWSDYPDDYTALREEIGWSEDYSARCEMQRPVREIEKKIIQGQLDQAAGQGLAWLEQCPIDIRVHMLVTTAQFRLGKKTAAGNHRQWVDGLFDSITASGDGETSQTPFVTISVGEEYDMLLLRGLDRIKQETVPSESSPLDLLTVRDKEGNESEIYFSPKAHWARLAKLFPAQ